MGILLSHSNTQLRFANNGEEDNEGFDYEAIGEDSDDEAGGLKYGDFFEPPTEDKYHASDQNKRKTIQKINYFRTTLFPEFSILKKKLKPAEITDPGMFGSLL